MSFPGDVAGTPASTAAGQISNSTGVLGKRPAGELAAGGERAERGVVSPVEDGSIHSHSSSSQAGQPAASQVQPAASQVPAPSMFSAGVPQQYLQGVQQQQLLQQQQYQVLQPQPLYAVTQSQQVQIQQQQYQAWLQQQQLTAGQVPARGSFPMPPGVYPPPGGQLSAPVAAAAKAASSSSPRNAVVAAAAAAMALENSRPAAPLSTQRAPALAPANAAARPCPQPGVVPAAAAAAAAAVARSCSGPAPIAPAAAVATAATTHAAPTGPTAATAGLAIQPAGCSPHVRPVAAVSAPPNQGAHPAAEVVTADVVAVPPPNKAAVPGHQAGAVAASGVDTPLNQAAVPGHQAGAGAAGGFDTPLDVFLAEEPDATGTPPSGQMNLVYRGMVFKKLLEKMAASRRLGSKQPDFTWKTRKVGYVKDQKPMFETVREEWRRLPLEARNKYGCANINDTPFPTETTTRTFFNDARAQYFKYKTQPKSNKQGRFWKDNAPTFKAILDLLEPASNDGTGDEAREKVTDKAQQANAERLAMRKAQQAARGNVTDIMESLQDQAGSLGERNVVDVERADAQLEISRKTHELLEQQGKEVAQREIDRDRKTEEFRKQQMAAEAARDQKQDVQQQEFMAMLSPSFRAPASGVVIPWDSYAEFWLCMPNIRSEYQEIVTEALPSLEELVGLAQEKSFSGTLKEAGLPGVPAVRIANFIQKAVYGKK